MSNWEEFTAKTVSDALMDATVFFKVPSFRIEHEVIEEEKSGLFGLFGRQAKIRARAKEEEQVILEKDEERPVELKGAAFTKETAESEKIKVEKTEKKEKLAVDVDVEAIVKKFLGDVFKAMNIEAVVTVEYDKNDSAVNISVEGSEMGILIGKRGQTLDSLQYLTSLVVNKETSSYLKVKLDTENYRERRRETLENLAKNIAFKVKRTKRPVALEPMNPYERRIIHAALQSDRAVETHSEGEEPYRKVVVGLRKGYRDYGNRGTGRSHSYNNNRSYNRDSYKNGHNRESHKDNEKSQNDSNIEE